MTIYGYATAFWLIKSATPGKMVAHAIIVDARSLQKPAPWQLVVRDFSYYPSMRVFGLGFYGN